MTQLASAYINILETSSVVLNAGTEDSSYPLWRLYDRNVGRLFKVEAVGDVDVKLDQGSSIIAIDRLIIPAGHNLSGLTLSVQWSDNASTWYYAVTNWTQADNNLITKSWASLSHRYWKFYIYSGGTLPPAVPEIFLTSTYTWERNPTRPTGPFDDVFNVQNLECRGGQDRFIEHGAAKRSRDYIVPSCGETQKDNILALNAAWAGGVPFWLCDHTGVWIFGKLTKKIAIKEIGYQRYSFEFGFLEVIP